MERRGRRCKQELDNSKEKIGNYKLIEDAIDLTVWRTRFGSGYVLVVRGTEK
jgi:hypothetical protein